MNASLIISVKQLAPETTQDSQIFPGAPVQMLDKLSARLCAIGLIAGKVPVVKPANYFRLSRAQVAASIDITVFAQRYRLQTFEADVGERTETVKLKRLSSFLDRLLGKDAFDESDAFVRLLQDMLEREPYVEQVEVVWR